MVVHFSKLSTTAIIPTKAHQDDAGMDFYYDGKEIVLEAGDRKTLSTGVSWEPKPAGKFLPYLQIQGRSGLADKYGILTLAGVIDSGYRGEIKIVLVNTGRKEFTIKPGDKIAQGIVHFIPEYMIVESDTKKEDSFIAVPAEVFSGAIKNANDVMKSIEDKPKKRGKNGFGSSDKKVEA
jgi:dUTP pyrophosphatase